MLRCIENDQKINALISTTSPPPASLMAAIHRPIWVRRLRRKSVGTLRTCPDLHLTLPGYFNFQLSVQILEQITRFRRHRHTDDGHLSPDCGLRGFSKSVGHSAPILIFLRPFLVSLSFGFSSSFWRISNLNWLRLLQNNVPLKVQKS